MKVTVAAAVAMMMLAGAAHAGPFGMEGGRGGAQRLMQADVNQDGRITKDEVRTQRQTAFERMDVNKDGFITEADRGGADAKRPQRGGRGFARLDANGDGKVSSAEFVDRGFEGFDRLDANKDGAVDRAEIDAARERRGAKAKTE